MYRFELAKQNDLEEIICFYHSLIGTPGCGWNLNYPNKEDVLANIDENSLYTLRNSENVLVSVAAVGKSSELSDLHWSLSNPCDLERLGVASTLQGRGIGTIMLNKVMNVAKGRGFDGIRLSVNKKNFSAIALYEKRGFIKCGETYMYGIDFYCYEMVF